MKKMKLSTARLLGMLTFLGAGIIDMLILLILLMCNIPLGNWYPAFFFAIPLFAVGLFLLKTKNKVDPNSASGILFNPYAFTYKSLPLCLIAACILFVIGIVLLIMSFLK